MVKVALDDLDGLCNGLYTLFVLTYLQGITLENHDFSLFEDEGVKISQNEALTYLWEQQYQTLTDLKLLIEKEAFSTPLNI